MTRALPASSTANGHDLLAYLDAQMERLELAEGLAMIAVGSDYGTRHFRSLAARELNEMGLLAHQPAGTDRIVLSEQVRPGVWRPMGELSPCI